MAPLAEKAHRLRRKGGAVAQLGERLVRNEEVRGSNPLGSTSLPSGLSLRSRSSFSWTATGPLPLRNPRKSLLAQYWHSESEFYGDHTQAGAQISGPSPSLWASIHQSMLRDADAWARQTEVQADRRELPADPNQLRAITLGQLITRSLFCCLPRRQLREIKPSLVARELAPVRHMLEIARREW
jgi:hypothetical protein